MCRLLMVGLVAVSLGLPALAQSSSVASAPPAGQASSNAVAPLKVVAESPNQWTGVAASREGRLFVNFPRWGESTPVSVGELKNGKVVAFPNAVWNSWQPGQPAADKFVCVQSVFVDGQNRLWVLDPASPQMKGVVKDGAKLVQIDLRSNKVQRVIRFDETIAPEKSYLNDVRIDLKTNNAFITDSGTGAIVVVDLATGKARRLLSDSKTTKSEGIAVVINGKQWLRDGKEPQIHADGIALDPLGKFLYFHALTGKKLYRVPVAALLEPNLTPEQLKGQVLKVADTVPCDGMEFGRDGKLYLSSIEDNSVKRLDVRVRQPQLETVVTDSQLDWPDSFALAPDGGLYVTASQIDQGDKPTHLYTLFKF